MSCGCSSVSVTHTWTPAPPLCRVLCQPMPEIQPSARHTVRSLMAWGSDCRDRQAECIGWVTSNETATSH